MDPLSKEKKDSLLELLGRRTMVSLLIDSRAADVVVPDQHRSAKLRLNLSYRMELPDLRIDDEGISVTLSFSGRQHPVRIPWYALWSVECQNEGRAWAASLPKEVVEQLTAAAAARDEAKKKEQEQAAERAKKRALFTVVK